MKMEQSVPKRRPIKFRSRGITKKKAYNIQNMAKVWNQSNRLFGEWTYKGISLFVQCSYGPEHS